MSRLALIRHGATAWNEAGRLQGRRDQGLSPAGRARIVGWRLPPELGGARWLTSPLRRATETAALLGLDAVVEPRLVEMSWGDWEGRILAELRREDPAGTAAREAAGLDLRPPGGESPREVQERLAPLLAECAARREATGWITHKGVIRAVLAMALGWDMRGRAPVRLDWEAAHLVRLAEDGRLEVERVNLPLDPARRHDGMAP